MLVKNRKKLLLLFLIFVNIFNFIIYFKQSKLK